MVDAVYRLRKIKSKYIILEILAYSGTSNTVSGILYFSNLMLRKLLIRNRSIFYNIVRRSILDIENLKMTVLFTSKAHITYVSRSISEDNEVIANLE